jgi:hypothetical protein
MKTTKKLPIALLLLSTTLFGTDFLTLKDGNSKYNNLIKKDGKYKGKVVSWDGVAFRDPTIPSGGNPFYYLKIKTEDNSTIDSIFYYGVSFEKQDKTIFKTDSCSKYAQYKIHNCVYSANQKYIEIGSQVEIVVNCGDSGCYTDSINQISKNREKITSIVPVMIGGEPDMDACSVGIIGGLSANGFLAVRSGASTKYPIIDKLYNGDSVSMCDTKGKWEGVVYGKDCRSSGRRDAPSSIIPKRKHYEGSCNSGWIYSKWIKNIFE